MVNRNPPFVDCPECDGSGEITTFFTAAAGKPSERKDDKCASCMGSGVVSDATARELIRDLFPPFEPPS